MYDIHRRCFSCICCTVWQYKFKCLLKQGHFNYRSYHVSFEKLCIFGTGGYLFLLNMSGFIIYSMFHLCALGIVAMSDVYLILVSLFKL